MLDVLKKFSGVIFFYIAIMGMLLLVNARFEYLNSTDDTTYYAMNE